MQLGLVTALFILFVSFLAMCVPHSSQGSAAKAIRTADPADLDSGVEVVRSATPLDSQWNYRFEHGHQFPEDNMEYTFIEPSYDDWHVMVAGSPSLEDPT